MTESNPILIVGGHLAPANLTAAMRAHQVATVVPEHVLDNLRKHEEKLHEESFHRMDAFERFALSLDNATESAKELVEAIQSIVQPSIEKPRISKHRQARQERFRARHK